jgi:hypothetical protein
MIWYLVPYLTTHQHAQPAPANPPVAAALAANQHTIATATARRPTGKAIAVFAKLMPQPILRRLLQTFPTPPARRASPDNLALSASCE